MDRLKRKIGFIIFASILAFATTFGLGASSLATYFSSPNYAMAETEDESVSANSSDDEISAMAADISYVGEYVEGQPTLSGDTVEITNSLFVYDSADMLGSLSDKIVEINNSIFVYTGTGSSVLFSGTPEITLNNVIFYAS